jgi:hypothetical protein
MKRVTERILYFDQIYDEGVFLLHNIYLEIREYIFFCRQDEFEGLHIREADEGNIIIATIQSLFDKLGKRVNEWKRGIAEKRTCKIQNINDTTADANEDSQNVYNIRVEVDDSTKRIYRQLNNREKIQVKNLCNQYFVALQELDSLMDPFIIAGEGIDRLWPFEDPHIVHQIQEWIKTKYK